jgi:hypothetical protein
VNRGLHDCPSCRCGVPRCPDCGAILPDHDEPIHLPLTQWCPRSPIVQAVKADEKQRAVAGQLGLFDGLDR